MVVAILRHLMTPICYAVFAGPAVAKNLVESVLNGQKRSGVCMICKLRESTKERWLQGNPEKIHS